MRYFAYVHQKHRRMVITDDDGNHLHDTPLSDSINIRQVAVNKLRELGYSPLSRWSEFSYYQHAEVRKNA